MESNALRRCYVLLLFATVATVVFWPYYAHGVSFYTFHALSGLMPIKHQITQSILSGEWPLWNPYMLAGAPFHSGIGVLDPLLVGHLMHDPIQAMFASCYLALLIAGVGMYLYLHKMRQLSIAASILGGILYMLNPFFAATSHELPFMAPPVYLPLIFWMYEWGSKHKNFFLLGLSGVFLGLSFYSGNLESYFFMTLFFTIFQLYLALFHGRNLKVQKRFFEHVRNLAVVGIFSLAFIAVDLFPSIEMIIYSGRNANASILHNTTHFLFITLLAIAFILILKTLQGKLQNQSVWLNRGLALGVLILFAMRWNKELETIFLSGNIFFPDVRQIMLAGQDSANLLFSNIDVLRKVADKVIPSRFVFYIQPPIYLFTLSSLVIFAAICGFSRSVKLRAWSLFGLMMIVFPYSSIPNLSDHLLGLEQIAFPRLMFGFFFILSVLIATFYQYLSRSLEQDARKVLLARAGKTLLLVSIAGIFFTFLLCARKFNPAIFSGSIDEIINTRSFLPRVFLFSKIFDEALIFFYDRSSLAILVGLLKFVTCGALGWTLYRPQSVGRPIFLIALCVETALAWNLYTFQSKDIQSLRDVDKYPEVQFVVDHAGQGRMATYVNKERTLRNFYDEDHLPELSANIPLFWNQRTIEGAALNLSPKLFADFWSRETENTYTPTILNVSQSKIYDLMGMTYLFSEEPIESDDYQLILKGKRFTIYGNHRVVPRFYFPKEVMKGNPVGFNTLIHNEAWNPRERVFIYEDVPESLRRKRVTENKSEITLLHDGYNHLSLKAKSIQPELLVLSEAFHPHWRALVNGQKGKLVRVNDYFRGVFLEPGEHQVEFRYISNARNNGLIVTGVALIVLIALAFISRRRYAS